MAISNINKFNLSEDASDIMHISLLTNAYSPTQNITEQEFMSFKSDWLIKDANLELIEEYLIKNQIINLHPNLARYLVDTYYGKKLNLKSNGRSGGTTNLYFEKGNISYEDLMKKNSRSLYITETIGHGSNDVTGDYSVGATGFLVEDGEFKYPVNEITIAGNFKDMFKNIILANDLEFEYSVNSPTMMIEGMTVAGK